MLSSETEKKKKAKGEEELLFINLPFSRYPFLFNSL